MSRSVDIAHQARIEAASESGSDRQLLIAASVGPYGACIGGGAEYDGAYGSQLGEEYLISWHTPRIDALITNPNTDLLAVETIPCLTEVRAILRLLKSRPMAKAWISVSCSSGETLCSGESVAEFA